MFNKAKYKGKIVYYIEYGTPQETKYFIVVFDVGSPKFIEVKKSELKELKNKILC